MGRRKGREGPAREEKDNNSHGAKAAQKVPGDASQTGTYHSSSCSRQHWEAMARRAGRGDMTKQRLRLYFWCSVKCLTWECLLQSKALSVLQAIFLPLTPEWSGGGVGRSGTGYVKASCRQLACLEPLIDVSSLMSFSCWYGSVLSVLPDKLLSLSNISVQQRNGIKICVVSSYVIKGTRKVIIS